MRCAAAAVGTASGIASSKWGRGKRNVFMADDSFSSNAAIFRHGRPASQRKRRSRGTGVVENLCPARGCGALLQLGDRATVARPRRLIGADRIGALLAVADGLDARRRDALGAQVLTGGVGAAFAERQVVLARAALVAMALDGDRIIGVFLQPLGLTVQGLPAVLADVGHVGVEEHPIADVLAEIGDRAGGDRRGRRGGSLLFAAAGNHEDHRCNGREGLDHAHYFSSPRQENDHILRYCGIKGDQAGSDASVGVGTGRSKRPVMSIWFSVTDPARPPELGCWRKNIRTRPLGAQVGPSTRKPLASMRSPLPSVRITPMPKLPPVILVKAMKSPRGDHTGVA